MDKLSTAVDWLLDRTVFPGYTELGYRLRSRHWDPDPAPGALSGAEVLITGASSGIGTAASERLARLGARVHMLGRRAEPTVAARERVADRLRRQGMPDAAERLEVALCDISDLDAVRGFAERFLRRVPTLDGLVHNAGVLPDRRRRSAQGHELTFATHVLGPFLLTRLLMPSLERAAPSRVVFVSSGGLYTARVRADDLELEAEGFNGAGFYAHSKRVQAILARELAARCGGGGICVGLMHPGWVDTPGLERALPRFHRLLRPLLRDPDQGADTLVWLLISPEAIERPGALWHDRRSRPLHRVPWTRESEAERRSVWDQVAELTSSSPSNESRKETV